MEQKPTTADFISVFQEKQPKPILKLQNFGILALLTDIKGELAFVMTKRATGIRQPGDICFPGGRQEQGESLRETALRETEEELGIAREHIQILGKSDFMLTVYGGLIQPYIGFVPHLSVDTLPYAKDEVAEIFTVPLSFFMENPPEVHYMYWQADVSVAFPYDRIEKGKEYPFRRCKVPELFYAYENRTIWGLTAQIVESIVKELQANK